MEHSRINKVLKAIKKKYSTTFAETFREIALNMQKLGRELHKA